VLNDRIREIEEGASSAPVQQLDLHAVPERLGQALS
jgi:hypothetical protein